VYAEKTLPTFTAITAYKIGTVNANVIKH